MGFSSDVIKTDLLADTFEDMHISSLNINGWTENNKQLRLALIKYTRPDVLCLQESHLDAGQPLDIEGYLWIGHNRKSKHVRAKKASGGVGILVKDKVLDQYSVSSIDKCFDGILVICLQHKTTDFKLTLINVYLPPENSIWGRDCDTFTSYLTSVLFSSHSSDIILVLGDFNARIGNELDYIHEIDDLPNRFPIDFAKHSHGDSLVEFLKDTKLNIINGRISTESDNFTCINNHGKSVVDYMMIPHDCINYCSSFKVETMSDLLFKYNLYSFISHG